MCVGEAQTKGNLFGTTVSSCSTRATPSFPRLDPRADLSFFFFVFQWFGIFLQFGVMAGFFIGIATDSLPLYQLQLCTFGAVSLVFAVQGCVVVPLLPSSLGLSFGELTSFLLPSSSANRANSVFGIIKAEQAAGAGWLILAIVDVRPSSLFLLPFPSPELSSELPSSFSSTQRCA